MSDTIDLKEYVYIIKSKLITIIIISALFVALSGLFSYYLIQPIYEVSTTLIVDTSINPDNIGALTGDTMDVTQRLALTYGEIIKSRTVLQQVINNLNLDICYEKLSKNINVSIVEGTQIINIKVRDTNSKRAANIANFIPEAFSSEAKRLVEANGIEVVDKAIASKKHVKPNHFINMIISGIFGVIFSMFIVIIKAYTDNKIRTPRDIQETLDWPLLGIMPKNTKKIYGFKYKPNSLEIYREIRTNIEYLNNKKNLKTILVTSTRDKEGKSTITSNLAISFANINKKVLIIDCDLRNPGIHKLMNIDNINGLTDILLEKSNAKVCIKQSNINNLDILTAGEIIKNTTELLSLKKIKDILEDLKESYDYIFIDSSPVGCVVDSSIISRYVDGVIFTISSGEISRDEVRICKGKLNKTCANVIGIVLNKYNYKKGEYIKYNYK